MDKFFSETFISLGIYLVSVVDLIRCRFVKKLLFKWSADGLEPREGLCLQWMYFYFLVKWQ